MYTEHKRPDACTPLAPLSRLRAADAAVLLGLTAMATDAVLALGAGAPAAPAPDLLGYGGALLYLLLAPPGGRPCRPGTVRVLRGLDGAAALGAALMFALWLDRPASLSTFAGGAWAALALAHGMRWRWRPAPGRAGIEYRSPGRPAFKPTRPDPTQVETPGERPLLRPHDPESKG